MDIFDLFAKISLDTSEYEDGLDDASKAMSSFGDKVKTGLATAAKVGAAAIGAAATAVGALTKASVDGYAEYEQLVGGVETLFETSADEVMRYAANAYKTAGLSANEYMDTVTSFSASLLQSLDGDTQAAAEKANVAIVDMADNANKMGTSMESIQNAYQGFAKQNYTMLDNLKLGYGGTKEEMQRLIDKANELNAQQGITTKYQIESYADIVDAIHVVQTEMGIMGTTEAEAATTIQGSVSAAKSAWENLVTGLADDNADLEVLIGNFVESVSTAAGNIIPRIEQVLVGVGEMVSKLAPILAAQIPPLISAVLPSMLSAGTQLVVGLITGIITAIPELVAAVPTIIDALLDAISNNLPAIAAAGQELLVMFGDGILYGIPDMLNKLPEVIDNFFDFISDNLPDVLAKGVETLNSFVTGIIDGIPGMLSRLPAIITSFFEFIVKNLPVVANAGMEVLANLVTGILRNLPQIGTAVGEIVGAIVKGFTEWWSALIDVGANIVKGVWDGIVSKAAWIKEQVTGFFGGILDGAKKFLGIQSPSKLFREEVGQYIGLGVAAGIGDTETDATKAAEKMAKEVYDTSKDWADRQTKYLGLSYAEQAELWETIQGQFVAGSEQYLAAEEKVFDARQKQAEEEDKIYQAEVQAEVDALEDRASAREAFAKKVEDINKNISDLEENYQKTLSSRIDEIANSYKLFDEVPERQKVSGKELIDNLSGQIAAIEDYYNGLDELAERGVGEDLVEELRGMGPSAIDELDALLSLSDEKLSEYAGLFAEKQALANSIATEELSELRDSTDAQILEQIQSVNGLYEEYAGDVGMTFTDMLAAGIEEGTEDVVNASITAAQSAMDAFNQTVGEYGYTGVDLDNLFSGNISSRIEGSTKTATPNVQAAEDVVVPVTLEIDGEVLARKTYRYNQNESARIGSAMVRV